MVNDKFLCVGIENIYLRIRFFDLFHQPDLRNLWDRHTSKNFPIDFHRFLLESTDLISNSDRF